MYEQPQTTNDVPVLTAELWSRTMTLWALRITRRGSEMTREEWATFRRDADACATFFEERCRSIMDPSPKNA